MRYFSTRLKLRSNCFTPPAFKSQTILLKNTNNARKTHSGRKCGCFAIKISSLSISSVFRRKPLFFNLSFQTSIFVYSCFICSEDSVCSKDLLSDFSPVLSAQEESAAFSAFAVLSAFAALTFGIAIVSASSLAMSASLPFSPFAAIFP